MRTSFFLLLPLFLLLNPPVRCQTVPSPGMSLAAVSVKPATTGNPYSGELYLVDTSNNKAAALVVPTWAATLGFNSIQAINPVIGLVTTIDGASTASPASAGDLFLYTITASQVTMVQLNTTPFAGGNLSQTCLIGTTVYVTTQDAAGANGLLYSVPQAGGAPTLEVDLGLVPGWGGGLVNACAAMNGRVYLATGWGSGQDELWVFDPTTRTTVLVHQFASGIYTTNPYPVHLSVDTNRNLLVLVGLYRDVFYIDVNTGTVVESFNAAKYDTANSKPHYHQHLNSGVYNPDTGDIVFGTRVGSVDICCGPQGTLDLLPGVGSSTTVANNSVTGMTYIPSNRQSLTFGSSGWGSSPTATYRFHPVNLTLHQPMAGGAWGTRLHGAEGGASALMVIGTTRTNWAGLPLPFDLSPFGATGSSIYCSHVLTLATVAAGSGPGMGTASFSFNIPASAAGGTFYCQWLVADIQANPLRLVTTNAREVRL